MRFKTHSCAITAALVLFGLVLLLSDPTRAWSQQGAGTSLNELTGSTKPASPKCSSPAATGATAASPTQSKMPAKAEESLQSTVAPSSAEPNAESREFVRDEPLTTRLGNSTKDAGKPLQCGTKVAESYVNR